MEQRVKVSVVSFLNARPFLYGLRHHPVSSAIELSEDLPSECAYKLRDGKTDIGLVPVAAIPEIKPAYLISDFCIAADGEVSSVLLLSDVPIQKIERIILDPSSRTSTLLLKILCSQFWNIQPQWLDSMHAPHEQVQSTDARLIIGDQALLKSKTARFAVDLAGEWKKFTGLPFVFACWVSNCSLPLDFLKQFTEALSQGISGIAVMLHDVDYPPLSKKVISDYLNYSIRYRLNEDMFRSMKLFFEYAGFTEALFSGQPSKQTIMGGFLK